MGTTQSYLQAQDYIELAADSWQLAARITTTSAVKDSPFAVRLIAALLKQP